MTDSCLIHDTRRSRVSGKNGPRRHQMQTHGQVTDDVPQEVLDEILEIANNHMGDRGHGQRLIKRLGDVVERYRGLFDFGVKFQFRDLNSFIHPDHRGSSVKYVKRFEETQLSDSDWSSLFETVKAAKFKLLATPFDELSVEKCVEQNVDYIKISIRIFLIFNT